jgi:hypothetical protein
MTSGIYGKFKTDKTAEAEGRWVEFPANSDGTIPRVKIARMSAVNPKFQARAEAIARDLQVDIDLDLLTNEKAKGPMMDLFLDTILLDWEHVQDEDGYLIPFSNARKVMEDLPDFYEALISLAKSMSTFRDSKREIEAGE